MKESTPVFDVGYHREFERIQKGREEDGKYCNENFNNFCLWWFLFGIQSYVVIFYSNNVKIDDMIIIIFVNYLRNLGIITMNIFRNV